MEITENILFFVQVTFTGEFIENEDEHNVELQHILIDDKEKDDTQRVSSTPCD